MSLVQNHVPLPDLPTTLGRTQLYPELLTDQRWVYFFIINCFLFENAANHIDWGLAWQIGQGVDDDGDMATIWRQPVKTMYSASGRARTQAFI